MTVWKQAFVLGGAVLLLAACDRATGPSTQLQRAPVTRNFIDLTGTLSDTTTIQDLDPCRSGYSVNSGRLEEVELSAACIDVMIDGF